MNNRLMTRDTNNNYNYRNDDIVVDNNYGVGNGTNIGVDLSFFTNKNNSALCVVNNDNDVSSPNPPAKRGRPSKKTKTLANGDKVVLAEEAEALPMWQSNEPYINGYSETTNMLKTAIVQIDILSGDIKAEIDNIKGSKTLKNKFSYLSELTSTTSSLMSTKIAAIREINKTITDCNNLDMKRTKDLKMGVDEVDDDKHIMDMYNAFISTPMGSYNPLGPNIIDITMQNGAPLNITRGDIIDSGDMGYNNYVNNMTPEQHRMKAERNPNIETVVVYNQESGERFFDVIDVSTGQSIPSIARPADFILDELNINVNTGTARHSNIKADYRLVFTGNNNSIMNY